jgi:hypothetical protein
MTLFEHLVASGVAALVVSICILIHYETLNLLERVSRLMNRHRWIVLITMFSLIVAHIVQMWVFALAYYIGEQGLELGSIHSPNGDWFDYVYFSAMVFTTVGFGDLVPTEGLRMLAMSEALAGFSLITWSASFTFLQMQRLWRG